MSRLNILCAIAALIVSDMALADIPSTTPTASLASGKDVMDAWKICLFTNAGHFARISRESATAIASASFGKCSEIESRVQATWTLLVGNDRIEQMMNSMKQTLQEQLISGIIEARSRNVR